MAPGEDTPVRRSVREAAFGALDAAGREGALLATQVMADLLDETLERELSHGPPAACARGCAWCCHVYVTVVAPEAIVALRWVEAYFTPDEIEALRARLRATAEGARDATPGEYPRQTCAFLVDGACSIHPARPAHCRAAHSVDVMACIAAYEARPSNNLTVPARRAVLAQAAEVRLGYGEALAHAKVDRTAYELQQVALLLLQDPGAAGRWLAGDVTSLDVARARIPVGQPEDG
jgi:hypothetical protein